MRYLSVCSGIEAATVAWEPLGWTPVGFAEIDPFPSAVLAHHFPHVKNHGDFTRIQADDVGPVDLLVGGTPCQSFSIAGLRGGLDDDRGNLALEFLRLTGRTKPRWIVWENVPGVLSSSGGRDFGSILGAMVKLGYGFTYRVLDAQYVRVDGLDRAVPQRRRRLFVVGYLGDWRRAAAVLFERESMLGNTPPSRKPGKETAARFTHCAKMAKCVTIREGSRMDYYTCNFIAYASEIAPTITKDSQKTAANDFNFNGGLVTYRTSPNCGAWETGDRTDALTTGTDPSAHVVTYSIMPMNSGKDYKARVTDVAQPVMAGGPVGGNQGGDYVVHNAVRRLTPVECERLQGFPDNWTRIPYRGKPADKCPDGPRYKAIGNSMAVNVVRWIGQRIQAVDAITR